MFENKIERGIISFDCSKITSIIEKAINYSETKLFVGGKPIADVSGATKFNQVEGKQAIKPVYPDDETPAVSVGSVNRGKSVINRLMDYLIKTSVKTLRIQKSKRQCALGCDETSSCLRFSPSQEEQLSRVFPSTELREQMTQLLSTVTQREILRKEIRKTERSEKNGSLIGNRVYNQRPSENHICELLSDQDVFHLIAECYEKFMNLPFELSSSLKKGLSIIITALYENRDVQEAEEKTDRMSTDSYGKLAQIHRVIEDGLGELIGCGLRTLQKSVAWLRERINNDDGDRASRIHREWERLKNRVADYLAVRIPQLVTPP